MERMMEVKILQSDALWRDILRIAHGEEYISLRAIRDLLDHSVEANVEIVVRCNRCVHGKPLVFSQDGKRYVCLKHNAIIDNSNEYYCASGERRREERE